ncbi:MAG: polyphosphate polymerase domain-containing protein [Proteobacteria bacterium]|nr:polyphosphate polymerase domain-containing protein [Pseudomonadota bacterium]
MKARYEFKYLITDAEMETVRSIASAYMEPDPYAPDGVYSVYSLYFDSNDYYCANATLEGLRERFKLRIRTYGFKDHFPVFVEEKGRVGTSIVKRRALIDRKTVNALCLGDQEPESGWGTKSKKDSVTLDRFRGLADGLRMQPRLWVGYKREPWVSPFGDGSRLTFDMQLMVQPPRPDKPFKPRKNAWESVPLEQPTILEMEFNGASPAWMQKIVHCLQLKRVSVSKYTLGAVQCWNQPWARPQWSTAWMPY